MSIASWVRTHKLYKWFWYWGGLELIMAFVCQGLVIFGTLLMIVSLLALACR